MKKLTFILLILLSNYLQGQHNFKIEEKSIIGIFEADNRNKEEIFTSINSWISRN
jgi:hypothetical protein